MFLWVDSSARTSGRWQAELQNCVRLGQVTFFFNFAGLHFPVRPRGLRRRLSWRKEGWQARFAGSRLRLWSQPFLRPSRVILEGKWQAVRGARYGRTTGLVCRRRRNCLQIRATLCTQLHSQTSFRHVCTHVGSVTNKLSIEGIRTKQDRHLQRAVFLVCGFVRPDWWWWPPPKHVAVRLHCVTEHVQGVVHAQWYRHHCQTVMTRWVA